MTVAALVGHYFPAFGNPMLMPCDMLDSLNEQVPVLMELQAAKAIGESLNG